ncbi:MAG: proline dehydrogenase family protein [Chloroflexota bacterium]|nr:proline dehydrogenase family protein [Chloroflexota bacterium]
MRSQEELDAAHALKSIARNLSLKSYLQQTSDLYSVLWSAARRFVTGETRQDGIRAATILAAHDYGISLEYMGENTTTEQECRAATDEFLALSQALESASLQGATISLDLSHIGLSVNSDLAIDSLRRLSEATKSRGLSLMISMEESDKLPAILGIYQQVVEQAPHIGITLQAHLYRTDQDLDLLLHLPGKIRLVKGAYQEPSNCAMSRGESLDERFFALAHRIIAAHHPLSIATHDERLLQILIERFPMTSPLIEVEMLYGIHPDVLRRFKEAGYRTRVYLTYGTEWYLYLCHRLAEYPPNIYQALADCVDPSRTSQSEYEYL